MVFQFVEVPMLALLSPSTTLNLHRELQSVPKTDFSFVRSVLRFLSSLTEDIGWASGVLCLITFILAVSRMDSEPDAEPVAVFLAGGALYALIAVAALLLARGFGRLACI